VSALQDLEIVATGCAVVLGALALLWGLTALVGRVAAFASRLGHSNPVAAVEAGVPAHHVVAIAAAVAAVLGEGHRIVGIAAPAHRVAAWASSARYPQSRRRPAPGGSLHERTNGS